MYGKRQNKISLKDNSSPATSYLLSVLEKKTRGDTFGSSADSAVSRMSAAFAAFDEILPHCGIYTPVLRLIREELTDGVYSETYTTSIHDGSSPTSLERVPFFILLQRLHDQRTDNDDLMKEKIETHKKEVQETKKLIKEKDEEIFHLKAEHEIILNQVQALSKQLNGKDDEIMKLEMKMVADKHASENEAKKLEENISEILARQKELQNEMEDLRRYKVSYDTLKDTFDLPPDKRPKRGFRRPVISTKKTQLLSSIEAASKLEQQIIEVQTRCLEEYDQYLEEVKQELTNKRFSDNEDNRDFYTEEIQLESLGDEMNSKLKNFQRLISGAVVELELVRQHRDSLQSQLTQMEQAENLAAGDAASNAGTLPPSSMAGGPGSSRMMTRDDTDKKTSIGSQISLESGLEEDTTPLVDPSSDPFNPQEKLLSKYSAMIYTSVNSGKTFDEITSAKFCVSCGEKTAVCPHKVTKSDMLLPLPHGCTHIKVSRPMVRVAVPNLAATVGAGMHEPDSFTQHDHSKWYDTIAQGHRWDDSASSEDLSIRRQLAPLWQDAKRRAGIDTSSSSAVCGTRDLTLDRIFSLLEQFYASIVWKDNHFAPGDEVSTVREYLYDFMSERYQEDEIAPTASYDFINAVVKYAPHDKIILILGLTLVGLVDGTVARYVHLMADLVDLVSWKEVQDFHAFAEAIYPSMHEDDLEQFVMEYTAFSENKISKTLVLNYIIHMITKSKEPRILDAESKLSKMPAKEKGLMSKEEFVNAMESVSPLANDTLLEKLVQECLLSVGSSLAAIKKLSCITAYISLSQVWQLLRSQIEEKVIQARMRNNEVFTKLQTSRSLVPEAGTIITMTQIKLLAGNISRLRNTGNKPAQPLVEEDFYWHSRSNTRDSIF
ncbi:uncharacterized protein LOC143459041 [Clavelina lepadiformis]|uniref:uncharacterized protein LOC143459041 n=1 Tax=Clavelina lepadiformis TaxID=159417 RepID=UPI004043813A